MQLRIEREHRKAKKRRTKYRNRGGIKDLVHLQHNSSTRDDRLPPKIGFSLPENSSFIGNFDSFSEIINEILKKLSEEPSANIIYLDLTNVVNIDHAAVIILLTLVNYLNRRGIQVVGSIPIDKSALQILVDSDFFSHVSTTRKIVKTSKDTIFTFAGLREVNTEINSFQIRKIMAHLTGKEDNYYPLYNALGEIQGNSVEHANKDRDVKNWFMSVHYEDGRCIIMMADIGEGIINTLRLLLTQKLYLTLSGQKQAETLLNLFQGEYQSSTREPNRNTGLPGIFESVEKKHIGKIHVITNKAYLELSERIMKDLKVNFPGTFYAIEITKDDIQNGIR